MNRSDYIKMLRAEYRAIHKQIIELEKRQEQIHAQLDKLEDQKHISEEVKEDESTN